MEEVKKKRGRKPKEQIEVKDEDKSIHPQSVPVLEEVKYTKQNFDPIKFIFDSFNQFLGTVFKF